MKNLLTDLTNYNQWANERMGSALQKLTATQLNLEQKSSFNTIRKTADHLADCEYNWMKRINGDSAWEFKAKNFEDMSDMTAFWLQQSKAFVTLAEQSDTNRLGDVISYKNSKGEPFKNELYKIITHLMNHSTYHRGQLVTMMRGAGATEIPATDLIVFYRQKSGQLIAHG
jgi:uncharacterized damage-inducible protein DinB